MEINFEGIIPRIVIGIAIILMVSMVYNPLASTFDNLMTSKAMNCPGYDYLISGTIGDSVYDYNSSLASASFAACNFPPLIPGLIMVAVMFGSVVYILFGSRKEQLVDQPQY